MTQTKRELESALPFAMEPVVYDFAINERGTWADLLAGDDALLPQSYYALIVPQLLQAGSALASAAAARGTGQIRRRLPHASRNLRGMVQNIFDRCCRVRNRKRPTDETSGRAARTKRV